MKLLFSYFSLMLYLDSIVIIETHPRPKNAVQVLVDLAFSETDYNFRLKKCVNEGTHDESWEAKFRRFNYVIRVRKMEDGGFYAEIEVKNILEQKFGPLFITIHYEGDVAASRLGEFSTDFPLYRDKQKNTLAEVYRIANLLLSLLQKLHLEKLTFNGEYDEFYFSIIREENGESIILINLSNLREEFDALKLLDAQGLDLTKFIEVISNLVNYATIEAPWHKKLIFAKVSFKQAVVTKRNQFLHHFAQFEREVDSGADYAELHESLQEIAAIL